MDRASRKGVHHLMYRCIFEAEYGSTIEVITSANSPVKIPSHWDEVERTTMNGYADVVYESDEPFGEEVIASLAKAMEQLDTCMFRLERAAARQPDRPEPHPRVTTHVHEDNEATAGSDETESVEEAVRED